MTDTMTPSDQSDEADPSQGAGAPPEAEVPEGAPPVQGDPVQAPVSGDQPTGPEKKKTGLKGQIQKIADDYVVPISDTAIDEWAKVLKETDEPETEDNAKEEKGEGDTTEPVPKAAAGSKAKPDESPEPTDPFKDYIKQVACGLYPTLAPQIQLGLTTKALLDPYVQVAQQVLGPVMTEPNWSDPKWSKALQGGTDPKTGRPVPMTLSQWEASLRQDPGHGWDKSPQAHDMANRYGSAIQQAFTGGQQ